MEKFKNLCKSLHEAGLTKDVLFIGSAIFVGWLGAKLVWPLVN